MDDPHPAARPVPGGAPPLPDGHTVPHAPRPSLQPPVSRREYVYGALCVLILAAVLIGVIR